MRGLKSLAKDTAIYGLSSIIGRFLNWLLVPFYTYVLRQTADYGVVTSMYAWTAFLLVALTYGMETGFFRFANREDMNATSVYKTALCSLFNTSVLFVVMVMAVQHPLAALMGYSGYEECMVMMAITVAMDAYSCIPFAYLRYQKRPIVFAALKLLFVALNIGLNLFFYLVMKVDDVRYVFVSNILATGIETAILLPVTWPKRHGHVDTQILRDMLHYCMPLLLLGVVGIMNQTLDKIIFPYLYTGEDAMAQLGIYGACFKVAMVMMVFTQAFRYAYEPFVFARHKDKNSAEARADIMNWYILCSYVVLLGVLVGLPLIKYLHILKPTYWSGLKIIPIVLWTYVFQGVYFNLSFWYKLTDQTYWGAYFSFIALVINFGLQILFVPVMGYYASCGAGLVSYFVVMIISYLVGQKKAPVPYDLKRIGIYTLVTLVLFTCCMLFLPL